MENINFINIIKSFFLGLFIGVLLQFYDSPDVQLPYRIVTVLASGSIGFIIGFITEWLTSLLPISMARARTYFFINNLIALIVTTLIMAALVLSTSKQLEHQAELMPILLIVLGIVCIANGFDYMMYRRAQKKLEAFKSVMDNNKL